MIESLTDEQEQRLQEFLAESFAIGSSTERS